MRKTLGILNIVAGVGILGLLILLIANGNYSVNLLQPRALLGLMKLLLIAGTSFASGILVLVIRHKKWWILAIFTAVNLIFAGVLLSFLVFAVLLALFD